MHGLVLMNAFHTSDKTNNSDVPQFALPPDPADNPADERVERTRSVSRG